MIDVAPVLLIVLLLAVVMWSGVALARYSQRGWVLNLARWTFLLTLAVLLNGLRVNFPALSLSALLTLLGQVGTVLLIIALSIPGAFILVRRYRSIIRAAENIVLIISPFILYTFSQVVWPLVQRAGTNIADKPPAATLPTPRFPAVRILWLVFDEMDQHVAFEGRPATVELPEIDRFRREAIYATKTRSPARWTEQSMPALITGKLVSKAEVANPNELMITFQGATKPVPWSLVPNVFSKAREAGVNTALVGWYHPYCRILGGSLTSCSWQPRYGFPLESTWFERMVWIRTLIRTIPLAEQLRLEKRLESALGINLPKRNGYAKETIPKDLSILRDAENVATNSAYGLILVHWPIPHPGGIYNRFKNDFAPADEGGYLDNLELVDRTLGELRRQMKNANLWDSSVVLITSDHPYRPERWKETWTSEEANSLNNEQVGQYVPFLLKLPGQKESVTYNRPFNSIIISDLFMALLHHRLSDPKSVVDWLDKQNR